MNEDETNALLHMHSYEIHMQSHVNSQQLVYRHTVSSFLKPMAPKKDQSTARILTNDPLFNTTASAISSSEIFFPAPQLYEMECSHDTENATCYFGRNSFLSERKETSDERRYRIRISHDAQKGQMDVRDYTVKAISPEGQEKLEKDYGGIESTTCVDSLSEVMRPWPWSPVRIATKS